MLLGFLTCGGYPTEIKNGFRQMPQDKEFLPMNVDYSIRWKLEFLASLMPFGPVRILLRMSIVTTFYNSKNLMASIFQYVLIVVGARNIKFSNLGSYYSSSVLNMCHIFYIIA